MRVAVVGLGSMGKRRLRCLAALGVSSTWGVDVRADRRDEVAAGGTDVFETLDAGLAAAPPDAALICVPPDLHHRYVVQCVERGLPCFVEAGILDDGMRDVAERAAASDTVVAPSATLRWHPAVRTIGEVVASGRLGRLSNVMYHCGQWLPDWHPYEHVSEFYVSNPLTGAAREIVPFELTWLTHVFGRPRRVAAMVGKTVDIEGAERIDDTYNLLLEYPGCLGTLTVDVVSRDASRRLVVNGDAAQLVWDWRDDFVSVRTPPGEDDECVSVAPPEAADGYCERVGEQMYVDEVAAFLAAVRDEAAWPNPIADDLAVLAVLYAAEESGRTGRFVELGKETLA